ncbi:SDR family oxidoreductase [Devosia sp. ZB163]|uniref:SDR family oxidoreductase n=1 Tax=Devosia sp. ZB163 TaxID=3025938 RepID=UPI002360183A|nr:SDR family oxidoreductase [Devosia sp. ZB163]MDC9824451.1 SDR family oxidoreductase [Devosia sp. ZB163]
MHFLVVGAAGFIGRHIVAALLAEGHRVTGTARDADRLKQIFPSITALRADFSSTTDEDWCTALAGIDVVVNAAGQLNRQLRNVHVDGPAALYRAALAAGVRRIILISAISARPDVDTDYARTKLEGEEVLRSSGVAWTILRPSLVVAGDSFGGSSVLRGLAGLPFLTPVLPSNDARFSPLHASDLGRIIARVGGDDRLMGQTLEPCGPETYSLGELVAVYRRWLGYGASRQLRLSEALVAPVARMGEWLGGPISTTTMRQLAAGNAGDAAAFTTATGFAPRELTAVLEAEPAGVQDRWHARLFFLAIAVRASLIFLWLASALSGLLFGRAQADAFAAAIGLPAALVEPLIVVTVLLDLVAAALLLTRRWRLALTLQLALVLGYTIGLTIALPGLWADPFGALLKNVPILALIAVNAALSESR